MSYLRVSLRRVLVPVLCGSICAVGLVTVVQASDVAAVASPSGPDYRVFVNGRAVELIEAPKPDKYYSIHLTDEQAQPYWAAVVDATGEVEVRVESDYRDLSATRLLPERPDMTTVSREKGVMTFRAKVPFKVSVEPTPRFRSLTVVAREPDSDVPAAGTPGVRRFRRGRHHLDEPIRLGSNETLYLEEGAFVEAAVYASGTNIAVRGHGVLSGACWPWSKGPATRFLEFEDAKDVLVKDVTLLGPYQWSLVLNRVERALVDGLVLLGGKVINDDGIDICRSKDVTVRDSFVHVQDDCIAVKWSGENILVEDCILWADVARIFHLGYESDDAEMQGIRVRNVDVLHQSVAKPRSGQPIVRIEASNGLRISDVDFEGIDVWSPESGDALLGVYTSVVRAVKGWAWYDKAGAVNDVRIRAVRYYGSVPADCGAVRMCGYDAEADIKDIVVTGMVFSPKTVELGGHVSGVKLNGLNMDSCCAPKQQ